MPSTSEQADKPPHLRRNAGSAPRILDEITSEQTTGRIAYRAQRLAAKFGLCAADEEDLQQDLFLTLLEAGRNYEADRFSPGQFITTVLDGRYKHHVRRLCERADHSGAAISMDDVEPDYEYSIPDSHDVIEELEVGLDVRTIVDALPTRHRQICGWLLAGVGVDEIATKLSTTPSALARDELALIRRRFEEADLTSEMLFGRSTSETNFEEI